jgi:hypothetical protein
MAVKNGLPPTKGGGEHPSLEDAPLEIEETVEPRVNCRTAVSGLK